MSPDVTIGGGLASRSATLFLHQRETGMHGKPSHFSDPGAVASYAADTPRKVPGLADLHRMAALLLAEAAPASAEVLVVGAGGGLELAAMAALEQRWRFIGVDPSPAMLDLAQQAVAPFAQRVQLVTGIIDQAPAGPFDGATCLLTLHFLEHGERLRTLREIRRRLRRWERAVSAPPSGLQRLQHPGELTLKRSVPSRCWFRKKPYISDKQIGGFRGWLPSCRLPKSRKTQSGFC